MNTLDQWEAEAKNSVRLYKDNPDTLWTIDIKRILALIDLVRKKDEALKFYRNELSPFAKGSGDWPVGIHNIAAEALALTDKAEGRTTEDLK